MAARRKTHANRSGLAGIADMVASFHPQLNDNSPLALILIALPTAQIPTILCVNMESRAAKDSPIINSRAPAGHAQPAAVKWGLAQHLDEQIGARFGHSQKGQILLLD